MDFKNTPVRKARTFLISLIIILVYIFPLYILLNVSVRSATDFSSRLFPTLQPIFDHYVTLLKDPQLYKAFGNTILYVVLEIVFLIPAASMGGYGLARSSGRVVEGIRTMNILTMMVPPTALLVGTYSLMSKLHLTNSIIGIALLGAGTSMTNAMFFYTAFTTAVPRDLDEAASIDGAGVLKTFFLIIFPQMKAITVTRLIGIVTNCWNNYLMPMYLLTKSEKFTVLLYVRKLYTGAASVPNVPLAFAGCVLMITPILIFYFLMQKHIISGQIDSAVKG